MEDLVPEDGEAEVAKEAADSAQGTADSKTTLWATLAIAQSSAVIGDMFLDNSPIMPTLAQYQNLIAR